MEFNKTNTMAIKEPLVIKSNEEKCLLEYNEGDGWGTADSNNEIETRSSWAEFFVNFRKQLFVDPMIDLNPFIKTLQEPKDEDGAKKFIWHIQQKLDLNKKEDLEF